MMISDITWAQVREPAGLVVGSLALPGSNFQLAAALCRYQGFPQARHGCQGHHSMGCAPIVHFVGIAVLQAV